MLLKFWNQTTIPVCIMWPFSLQSLETQQSFNSCVSFWHERNSFFFCKWLEFLKKWTPTLKQKFQLETYQNTVICSLGDSPGQCQTCVKCRDDFKNQKISYSQCFFNFHITFGGGVNFIIASVSISSVCHRMFKVVSNSTLILKLLKKTNAK